MNYNIFSLMASLRDDLIPLAQELVIEDRLVYEQYQRKIIDKYGMNAFPYVMAEPYYTVSENHHNHRFFTITFDDGDSVGVFIKTYAIYGNSGSYIWFKPISLKDNTEHEKLVLEHLVSMGLKFIEIPKVLPHINYDELAIRSNDYYVNVPERFAEVNRSKHRGTKGINKLKNAYGIEVRVNDFDPEEIHNLCYYWWKEHKKPNRKISKEVDAYIKLVGDNVTFLTYYLDNKLVGFSVITTHFGNKKIVRIQHNRHIVHTQIDFTDEYVQAKLGHYMHYSLMKYLYEQGFEWAYIGDDLKSTLRSYKQANFKYMVENYDLPPERWEDVFK